MKTNKKVWLKTSTGRNFRIDVHEIADHRAKKYADRYDDSTYEEEYDFLANDDFEVTDWLFNNMDWEECETLKELPRDEEGIWEIEIDSYGIVDGQEET